MSLKPIRVEIDEAQFWRLSKMHPVTMNIRVIDALRNAGIPVDGGIEFRGVKHGRVTMFNEHRDGKHLHVYEWEPMQDSEDDEL